MKKDFSHLKDIKLEQLNDTNISILIGADELKLHLYTESRIGNKNEPVALFTTPSWMLMGGKFSNSKISTNVFKRESEMLDKSIECFWQTESYGILKKDDPILILKQDPKQDPKTGSKTGSKGHRHFRVNCQQKE